MKPLFLAVLITIFYGFQTLFAQQDPDKASFKKLSIQANSSFTGNLSTTIDLLTVPGRNGLDFPIRISYNHDVNYGKHASWVGLNWSLQVGSITRSVNMMPDDQSTGLFSQGGRNFDISNTSYPIVERNGILLGGFNDNFDTWLLNLNDGTEELIPLMDPNGLVLFQTQQYKGWYIQYGGIQNMMIQSQISDHIKRWEIKKEDGTTFQFGNPKYMYMTGIHLKYGAPNPFGLYTDSNGKYGYPFSWDLKSITTHDYVDYNANNELDDNDIGGWVKFSYAEKTVEIDPVNESSLILPEEFKSFNLGYEFIDINGFNDIENALFCDQSGGGVEGANYLGEMTYELSKIDFIETPTHKAIFSLSDRTDFKYNLNNPEKKLDAITLYKKLENGSLQRVSKVVFEYEYKNHVFGRYSGSTTRQFLELTGIMKYGATDADFEPKYQFTRDDVTFSITYPEGGRKKYVLEDDSFQWYTAGYNDNLNKDTEITSAFTPFTQYYFDTPKLPWNKNAPLSFTYQGIDYSLRIKQETIENGLGTSYQINYNYGEGVVSQPRPTNLGSLYKNGLDKWWHGGIGYRNVTAIYPDGLEVTTRFSSSVPLTYKKADGTILQNDERESYPNYYQLLFQNPDDHEDGRIGVKIESYDGLHGIPYETVYLKNGKEFKREETRVSNYVNKILVCLNSASTEGVPIEFYGQQGPDLGSKSNRYFYDENLRMVSDGSYFADYRNSELSVWRASSFMNSFYKSKYVKLAYKSYWNQWKTFKTTIDSVVSKTTYLYNPINNLPKEITEIRKMEGSATDADIKTTKISYAYETHEDLYKKNILSWPKKTEVGTEIIEEDYYSWDTAHLVSPFFSNEYKKGEITIDALVKPGFSGIEKWMQFPDKHANFYYAFEVTVDQSNPGGGFGFWFYTDVVGQSVDRIFYPPNFTNPEDIYGGYYLFIRTSDISPETETGLYSYRLGDWDPQPYPFQHLKQIPFNEDQKISIHYAQPNGDPALNGDFYLKTGRTYLIEVNGISTDHGGGVEVRIDNKPFFKLIPQIPSENYYMHIGGGLKANGLTSYKSKTKVNVTERPIFLSTQFYPLSVSENFYSLSQNLSWLKTSSLSWLAENAKDKWGGENDPDNDKVNYCYDTYNRLVAVENLGKNSVFSRYKNRMEKPSMICEAPTIEPVKQVYTFQSTIPADVPDFLDDFSIDNVTNQINYNFSGNISVSNQKLVLDGTGSDAKLIKKNQITESNNELEISFDLTLSGNHGFTGIVITPNTDFMTTTLISGTGCPLFPPVDGTIFISFKTSGNQAELNGIYTAVKPVLGKDNFWFLVEEGDLDYLAQNPNPLILVLNNPYKVKVALGKNSSTNKNYLSIDIFDNSGHQALMDPIKKIVSSYFYKAQIPLILSENIFNKISLPSSYYLGFFSQGTISTIDNLVVYNKSTPVKTPIVKTEVSTTFVNPGKSFSDLFDNNLDLWSVNSSFFIDTGSGRLKLANSNPNRKIMASSQIPLGDFYIDCILDNQNDIGIIFNGDGLSPTKYQMIQLKAPYLNFVQVNGTTTTTVISNSLQPGINRKVLILISRSKNKFTVWLDGNLAGTGNLNNMVYGFIGAWINNDLVSSFDHFKAYFTDTKVVNVGYENIFDQVASISNTDDKTKIFSYDGLGRLTAKTSRYYTYGQLVTDLSDMAFTYDWGRISPTFAYPMTKPNSIKTIDYTANPANPSEAIGFFDGLGRNIQNKVKITGSSTGTLITGSIFDQNGAEAGSSIPVWSASTSLTYSPTFWTTTPTLPLAGATLSSGMVYDYALSQGYSAAEASKAYQYAETDALGRVTTSFLPGHLNGKIRTYYASNKDHELPLILQLPYGVGLPSLTRTEIRDELGNGSFTFADNFGKTIATFSKVGEEDSWTHYRYNLFNQLLEVTHPNNKHTFYTYGTHGNLIKKETPYFDQPFEYRYDQYNRVRFSRDANDFIAGVFHYFKYNKAGQVIETGTVSENATNDFETLNYLTVGDPEVDLPLTGKTADYQYFYGPELAYSNATYTLGRLAKEISLVNKETGATSTRYYSYNADGQIIWTVDEFPGISPKKITYTNDRKGNLKTLSYEDGKKDAFTQFFDYNSAGQMEASYAGHFTDFVTNYRRKTGVYSYFADGRGKQTQFAAANGTSILQSVDYSFGIEGWMKKINDLTSTTDLYAMDYSYLQNGQISAINQKIDGTFTASVNQGVADETTFGESYTYDNASRLTAATSTGAIASKYNSTYSYDLMGNITRLTRKNNNTDMDKLNYLYGSRNRLIGITDQIASNAFTTDYDAALTTGTSLDQEVFFDNFNSGTYAQSGWSVSVANSHFFKNQSGLITIKPATMNGLNTAVFASLKSPVINTSGGARFLLTGLVTTTGYYAQLRLEWQKIVNNVATVIRSDIKTVINPANGAQSLVVTAPEDAQQAVIYLELKSFALADSANFDNIKLVEVVGFKYDANGNVISDRYRGLNNIEYNGFNLPSKLVNSASQTVNYGYAGTGSRILKKVNTTSNWYLRTVTGEILAEIEETGNVEKLKYVKLFGNKGVIGEYTPSHTGNYNFHFYLEDHLGNNKVTFTDKALASDGFEAQTIGTGFPTGLWSNTESPTSPAARVATVTDTQGGKSLTLTTIANNYPYEYVQIASVTKGVTAGTSYFLKAWGKAGSSSAGVYIGLGWYNSSNVLLSESWLFNNETPTLWKQKGGSFVAPTGATKVKILLKNASSLASIAYFDEIWLGESSDRVLVEQTQDYYPYGSAMRQHSSSVSTENVSKFKYQGKERDVESGYDDFGGRLFDSQIGRSMQVDPHEFSYPKVNPYNSMFNNPIMIIDPTGKDVVFLPSIPSDNVKKYITELYIKSKTFREGYNHIRSRRDFVWALGDMDLYHAQNTPNVGETTLNKQLTENAGVPVFLTRVKSSIFNENVPAHELIHALKLIIAGISDQPTKEKFEKLMPTGQVVGKNAWCDTDVEKLMKIIRAELENTDDDLDQEKDANEIKKILYPFLEENDPNYNDPKKEKPFSKEKANSIIDTPLLKAWQNTWKENH